MNFAYQYADTHYPYRIQRLTCLTCWLCFLVSSFVAGTFVSSSSIILILSGALLFLFLFVGLFRWVLIPRLRDMGVEPAWAWSLLFFVHPVSFLFLLALFLAPTNFFAKHRYIA